MRVEALILSGALALGAASAQAAAAYAQPATSPQAATPQTGATETGAGSNAPNPDPFERENRAVYRFNRGLDRAILRPSAVFYKRATPRPVRDGIHNLVTNLGGPITFINDVLQVRPVRAGKSLGRFVLNTTVGVGGIFDVASGAGLPYHASNFGQTLGRYGTPTGPYLFLPVFGPSSVRDTSGKVVDFFLDPFNSVRYEGRTELGVFRAVGGGLDARARADKALMALNHTATDPYATIRSFYLQNSAAKEDAPGAIDLNTLPNYGPPTATPAPAIRRHHHAPKPL